MAYDIGDRVISKFTGPGTVTGLPFRTYDDENDKTGQVAQEVTFDLETLGKRDWLVRKLSPAPDGGDIGA